MKANIILMIVLTLFSCKKDEEELEISNTRGDSGVTLNIPLSGSLQNPSFAPDGEQIVFTRFVNGYNQEPAEIYSFNLTTNALHLLVSDGSGNVNLPGSSWNNGKIVFSSSREPHDEIFIVAEDGQNGDEIQITNRANNVAYEPTFNPDGDWVVFESHILDVEGNGVVTKYKVDGTSSYIALTPQGDDCRQPNWSPLGDKILYQKMENNQWNIWVIDADGSNPVQVTSNIGNCTDASFTSDGLGIVFSSDYEVDIANIYQINIDGSNAEKITSFDGYDGAVSISNSGDKLVFESINADPDESTGTKIVLLDL